MNQQPSRDLRAFRRVVLVGLFLAVPVAIAVRLRAADEKSAPAAKPSQLAKDLVGTWILVGTPDQVGEAPKAGGRLKFFTGKHWCITEADSVSAKVVFHHGGTYTLDGDEYAETIEYANDNTAELIKETNKFKIKVEGDTYTQIGVGNPYNEVWKRLK
jgi:hypothetical protein